MTEEQRARLDRLLSGMTDPPPDPETQLWLSISAAEARIRELRAEVAALTERVRALEANSDLVGEAVDELIAGREGVGE